MYKIIPLFLLILVTVFSCSTSADISVSNSPEKTEVLENMEVVATEPLLTLIDTPKEEPSVSEAPESVEVGGDTDGSAVTPVDAESVQKTDLDSVLITRTISYLGYEIRISAYDGYALVDYPIVITRDDITKAIGVLISTYPGAFDDVSYELLSPGYMRVVYPKGLSAEALDKTIDGLEKDLIYYITMLFADEESAKAPEESVVVPSEGSDAVVDSVVDEPVAESNTVEEAPVVAKDVEPVKEDATPSESAVPVAVPESDSAFPTPILDDAVSPTLLKVLSVVIVSTVIFTVSVAIRGANKLKLQKGISTALSVLFTALSIVISTLVAGWSNVWLIYLVLLLTYFIFRAEWRGQSHFG